MKILGMICGIGSMMVGAKAQGAEVIGNIEWRRYYWTGTFEHNFPGAWMAKDLASLTPEQRKSCEGVDMVIGHTECGEFSRLNISNVGRLPSRGVENDTPRFVEAVQEFQPRLFAMDNLPKLLDRYPAEWWAERLPGYEVSFQYVSNYNYGNPQKNRRRMFVIGARRGQGWRFVPGEFDSMLVDTAGARCEGIPEWATGNEKYQEDTPMRRWFQYDAGNTGDRRHLTFKEFREFCRREGFRPGQTMYGRRVGDPGKSLRMGSNLVDRGSHSPVLFKQPTAFWADDCQPLTIRERERIMGLPDGFDILPTDKGLQDPSYMDRVIQTGKCMPVEFTSYLTGLAIWFLEGNAPEAYPQATGERKTSGHDILKREQRRWCALQDTVPEEVCRWCQYHKKCPVLEGQGLF